MQTSHHTDWDERHKNCSGSASWKHLVAKEHSCSRASRSLNRSLLSCHASFKSACQTHFFTATEGENERTMQPTRTRILRTRSLITRHETNSDWHLLTMDLRLQKKASTSKLSWYLLILSRAVAIALGKPVDDAGWCLPSLQLHGPLGINTSCGAVRPTWTREHLKQYPISLCWSLDRNFMRLPLRLVTSSIPPGGLALKI